MYLRVMFGFTILDRLQTLMVRTLKVLLTLRCTVPAYGLVLKTLTLSESLCGLQFRWWNLLRTDSTQSGAITTTCGPKLRTSAIRCLATFFETGIMA